ncbi:rhomboid family intramembrane serine protease [Pararhodobacter sp. SW119]|uniref:rhomboid family intramembrane serine protease n=1 Tax=Pararhodobacter sp. SW119 TaxID=2780075 RepID=UPI001AE0BED1|nr:rhomboid family intramembrane serine protease [Pararhodobacter sp. SW119]
MAEDEREERLRDLNASPLNPLPALVWLVILALAGIELVLWLGGQGIVGGPEALGWRLTALQRFGFSTGLQVWMLENLRLPLLHLVRYPAYSFVHAGPLHAVLVIVLIAALGKAYGEAQGSIRLFLMIFLPPILGAVAFGLVLGAHELGWLFGGMAMVFGLVGGLTWWRWRVAGDRGARVRAFGIIGALLLARLGFGLMVESGHGWIAELAAFAVGFGLAAAMAPGRWAALRARLLDRG